MFDNNKNNQIIYNYNLTRGRKWQFSFPHFGEGLDFFEIFQRKPINFGIYNKKGENLGYFSKRENLD